MQGRLLLGCACVLFGCHAFGADLKMQIEPAFVGFAQLNGTMPLAVTLINNGADARGSLKASSGDFVMEYPVELPHGTTKRLITYPTLDYGAEVSFDLSTNQGNLHSPFRQILSSDPSAQTVLLIGDSQGDLIFLRPKPGENTTRLVDCYVKPEDAPDRPIAYSSISAVVLGHGSERLPDAVVRALHTYLTGGGTVAFLGGPSPAALGDRRWNDVKPVQPRLPRTVKSSELIGNLSDTALGSPFTIIDCMPSASASVRKEGGDTIIARRDVGLGKAVFFAFDPLEQPFTRWPGRRSLFEKVLRPIDFARSSGYLRAFTNTSNSEFEDYSTSSYASRTSGRMVYNPATGAYEPASKDPFSTKLPPARKVFWILGSYFIVIIPVNFLLLKKLKRGEWAWFTAPLISVGFAGAFFAAASDLYSARLSTATQGILVASEGSPDALFVGKSQMFFPQGGEYDLKMENLDSLGSPGSDDPYSYRYRGGYREPQSLEGVNPVDVGHVVIPRMDVTNLAFREISYQEIVPRNRWFQVSLKGQKLTVTNISPYSAEGGSAIVAGKAFPFKGSIGPGQSATLSLPEEIVPDPTGSPQETPSYRYGRQSDQLKYAGLTEVTGLTKEIVIKAALKDMRVGPGIGDVVKEREEITLAFFTGLHFGRASL